MQRCISKLSCIVLAIAASLASRSASANPASERRAKKLSGSTPLIRTEVQYGSTLDAWAPLPSIDLASFTALDLTLVVPRVVEPTPIAVPTPIPAPTPIPGTIHVLTRHDLELTLNLIRDAGTPTPPRPPDPLPAIHAVPRAALDPPLGLSDPTIVQRITRRAPEPQVTVELSPDGTGILYYIDHRVGIPILLAGKPTNEHAARNFAAVAHDRSRSFPRSLTIDAAYGVDVELIDGSHVQYTDDDIRRLVPPEHVLRVKSTSRHVAAR